MKMTNQTYDRTKNLVQVVLPASATLYFAIANIWGLPNAENVVGTMAAITTFLGVSLGFSNVAYQNSDERFDGTFKVGESIDGKVYSLELNGDPENLEGYDAITFKVVGSSDDI